MAKVVHTQNRYRRREKLTVEVRELRAKALTIAYEKMKATRQSNIIGEIERRRLPLRESLEPNKVIRE